MKLSASGGSLVFLKVKYSGLVRKITSGAQLVILVPVDPVARFIMTLAKRLAVGRIPAPPTAIAAVFPKSGT
jgi:hypothetical protein